MRLAFLEPDDDDDLSINSGLASNNGAKISLSALLGGKKDDIQESEVHAVDSRVGRIRKLKEGYEGRIFELNELNLLNDNNHHHI